MNTLYKSFNILRLKDTFELEIAKFMHSFHHNKIPESFNSYFRTASHQHTHVSRSITNKNYFLKRVNTKYGQSSFNFHGVKIWNKIPLLNKSLSWHSFTRHAERGVRWGHCPGTQGARPARLCQFFHDFIKCTSTCDDSR